MSKIFIQVKFVFKGLPFIVCDVFGKIYELPNCPDKRTHNFKEIKPYINNICIGYRINSKYYSKKKLNSLAIKDQKIIELYKN